MLNRPALDDLPARRAIAERVNRLQFDEYKQAAWLKVAPRDKLPPAVDYQDLIRSFLDPWLVENVPENVGAFALEPERFRSIPAQQAHAEAERIIAETDPRASVGGCLSWLTQHHPDERGPVPYANLKSWFVELFGHFGQFYQHPDNALVGVAPDLIGMLWLE